MTEVQQPDTLQEVKFYLHTIKFTPYNAISKKTNDILIDLITFLNREHLNGKAYAIDRNKNKPEMERREMFMLNPVRDGLARKIKCSLGLVRDKALMVKPNESFELIPFSKTAGSIVEQTRFYIDYSISPAIMCVEFNHNGPRISDIEYYFRNLAFSMSLAKACQTTTFLDVPIDNTLKHLHNVLNFEIKLRPQSIAQMDNDIKGYITDFANIGNRLKPNFIRIEAMFQTPGAKVKSEHLNKEANTMIKALLNKFKDKPFHIDQFEEFEIKFVDENGKDDTFNLIKGKREIVVKVERGKHLSTRKLYELIESDFNKFIKTFEV